MSTLNENLTFEHESEHVFEHDLQLKRLFSDPKIYTANGNLNKRWYVYFSYRNPDTGKLQRMKNVYGKANTYKTKETRLSILTNYRKRLILFLNEGYNPFHDNTDFFKNKKSIGKAVTKPGKSAREESINELSTKSIETAIVKKAMSLNDAFEFGLKLKEVIVSTRTLYDYNNKKKAFLKWLTANYPEIATIDKLTKKAVLDFLNDVQIRTSARNRNNHRIDLGSIMQVLEDNEIMEVNFMKKIPVLKTSPERHKRYTVKLQEDIFTHLEQNDPILLLFIKFISYNFLRPMEVCRLKIKDINLENSTIEFKAKNSPLKTKIIPEILKRELPDLTNMDPEHFLFGPTGYGFPWDAAENNRRDYFTKRFGKVVKKQFNLDKNYGLYSFRHTSITKLYRQLEKEYSPYEAKSRLMQITGHATMNALEKYLRNIDAQLPEDYSNLLK